MWRILMFAVSALLSGGSLASASNPPESFSDSGLRSLTLPKPEIIAESPIPPPTATFQMAPSAAFSFVTIEEAMADSAGAPLRLKRLLAGSSAFPVEQHLVCLGPRRLGDAAVVTISWSAWYRSSRVAGVRDGYPDRRAAAVADIDSGSGFILREIRTQNQRLGIADTLSGTRSEFAHTLWDFYGPWMLHLSDTFHYARTMSNPLAGITTTSLETIGRDTIEGRPCWVVRSRTGVPDYRGLVTMYWVDVAERVVVQVRREHLLMRRIAPPSSSPPNEKK